MTAKVLLIALSLAVTLSHVTADILGNSAHLINQRHPGVLQPLPASTLATIRQLLVTYVSDRQVPAPAGVLCAGCLFSSWQRRTGSGHARRFALANLDAAMSDYPLEVRQKLRALMFMPGGSTNFENFSLTIADTHAVKQSYIGVARRVQDNVEVAITAADIAANLIQKYVTLSKKTCKKILGIKIKCKTHTYTEPRGYYANEISAMKTMLQSETFKLFHQYASGISV